MYAVPFVRPVTTIGDVDPVALMPPGLEVARYVTVPFPTYKDGVKTTVIWALPTVGVPIIGALGFLPPESLAVMSYAAKSPTKTQVSLARLMSVA